MAKASNKKKQEQVIIGSFDDVISASVRNVGKQPAKKIKPAKKAKKK